MRKVLLILLVALSSVAFAQKKDGTLTAEVYNKETGETMTSAILQMYSLPDSVFKVGAPSDLDGKINVKVQPGKYYARITYVGCQTFEKDVTIEKGKVCELGRIDLQPSGKLLDDVTVSEEVPPVVAAEDTLVFNTAAFRVPEGSMLEELIKKYPGVTKQKSKVLSVLFIVILLLTVIQFICWRKDVWSISAVQQVIRHLSCQQVSAIRLWRTWILQPIPTAKSVCTA